MLSAIGITWAALGILAICTCVRSSQISQMEAGDERER